jgi:hypothetical protein
MSKYISNSKKVSDILDQIVIPYIKHKGDVDYYKLISEASRLCSCPFSFVEKEIAQRIATNQIIERRILTIGDSQINSFLNEYIKKEKEIKKEVEGVMNDTK